MFLSTSKRWALHCWTRKLQPNQATVGRHRRSSNSGKTCARPVRGRVQSFDYRSQETVLCSQYRLASCLILGPKAKITAQFDQLAIRCRQWTWTKIIYSAGDSRDSVSYSELGCPVEIFRNFFQHFLIWYNSTGFWLSFSLKSKV